MNRRSFRPAAAKPDEDNALSLRDGGSDGPSLLLIEDDGLIRESLLDWLASVLLGSRLVGAPSVEVAALASVEAPQVIVVDIALSGDDGIDTVCRLRRAFPATQIIALGRGDDSQPRDAVLGAGANACLLIWEVHEKLAPAVRRLLGTPGSAHGAGREEIH